MVPMPSLKKCISRPSLSETRPYQSFCTPRQTETDRYKRLYEREVLNNSLLAKELQKLEALKVDLIETNEKLLKLTKSQS